MSNVFIVMGVTCSGKSTLGQALANTLGIPFYDGDDFHPQVNIDKMKSGLPLNDDDRIPWLKRLNQLAIDNIGQGAVIACSALKHTYRNILKTDERIVFVYLHASKELIASRLKQRKGHFMPATLLESQFEALEAPNDVIKVEADQSTPDQIRHITARLA